MLTYAIAYLGCDSGISHLAGICNTPGWALFGETSSELFRPWGNIQVINSPENKIENLQVHKVIEFIEGYLEDR